MRKIQAISVAYIGDRLLVVDSKGRLWVGRNSESGDRYWYLEVLPDEPILPTITEEK